MPEVRWALLATVLFAAGRLLLRLAAVPSSLTGVVFAGYYLAGGWGPAAAGGPQQPRAAASRSELGITEVYAALLPEDKAKRVQTMRDLGEHVLVVGDGINDAPALATANLGVAMGRHGSDLTLQTADAVLVRDELAALPTVLHLSRLARPQRRSCICLDWPAHSARRAEPCPGDFRESSGSSRGTSVGPCRYPWASSGTKAERSSSGSRV